MAEILTESFCERCGSRYTFESEVPRARLRGVKVLSKGLKNFVLDDKTSIDEAMAAARDDTDRALTSHQLEAFHKTFNFCMQCRQYICPNCWNDGDGLCLSCAPLLGGGIPAAPFPHLDPVAGIAPPDGIGPAAAALNGHGNGSGGQQGSDALARLDSLTAEVAPTSSMSEMIGASEVEARAEAAEDPTSAAEASAAEPMHAEPGHWLMAVEPAAEDPIGTETATSVAETDSPPAEAEAVAETVGVEAADEIAAESDVAHASDPGASAAQTDILLAGLQPGQSLDEAIAAFESQPTVAAELAQVDLPSAETPIDAAATTSEATTEAEPAAEPAAAAIEPLEVVPTAPEDLAPTADWVEAGRNAEAALTDVPLVADVEPDAPVAAIEPLDEIPTGEPFATDAAAVDEPWQPEPLDELVRPEPLDAGPVAPEPTLFEAVAAAATADVVEQPAWSIVAPSEPPSEDLQTPFADQAIEPVAPVAPTGPAPEPSWPTHPTLPTVAPSTGLPFLGRHATPTGGVEALWAASDLAVSAPRTGAGKPAGGVQPCVSCGLSLSGTARFCRRCGSAQVA